MSCLRITLLLYLLICVVPHQSHESFHDQFLRNLADHHVSSYTTLLMSPSPSPVPSPSFQYSGNDQTQPICDKVSNMCDIKDYTVTACVPSLGNGSEASYVVVQNGGDKCLKINIIFHPGNITLDDTIISGHDVKKVNVPSDIGRNSSITLNIGDEECVIHIKDSITLGFYIMTPINGTYVFFAVAFFIGGILICCKLAKPRRHFNGAPYHELEMTQQSCDSTLMVETQGVGWDQNWDEEKVMRSSSKYRIRKVFKNDASLNYIDTTEWGNDWDD